MELRANRHQSSTKENYYRVWKLFNSFFIWLDDKPGNWEDHIHVFAGYLIHQNKKSATVKSYVSAIKAVLANNDIEVNEDCYLLGSLTRACRITKDKLVVRLPIQKQLLNSLLRILEAYFADIGQLYLKEMYLALFSTAYYGLFRIGELTQSQHTVKACDVHIADNKEKMLFVLHSSKTHGLGDKPQMIKITNSTQS